MGIIAADYADYADFCFGERFVLGEICFGLREYACRVCKSVNIFIANLIKNHMKLKVVEKSHYELIEKYIMAIYGGFV